MVVSCSTSFCLRKLADTEDSTKLCCLECLAFLNLHLTVTKALSSAEPASLEPSPAGDGCQARIGYLHLRTMSAPALARGTAFATAIALAGCV